MANYKSLKTTINANVKRNGNQEITGQILNSVLNAMVDTLGTGYSFAGVATPSTNPGTPDAKVFYIANGKGTYTLFGDLEVTEDDVVILYYDTDWHKESTGIAREGSLTELGKEIATKQNALTDTDGGYGQRVAKLEEEGIASDAKLTELEESTNRVAFTNSKRANSMIKEMYLNTSETNLRGRFLSGTSNDWLYIYDSNDTSLAQFPIRDMQNSVVTPFLGLPGSALVLGDYENLQNTNEYFDINGNATDINLSPVLLNNKRSAVLDGLKHWIASFGFLNVSQINTNTSFKYLVIPVKPGDKVRFVAGVNVTYTYYYITKDIPSYSSSIPWATGYDKRQATSAGVSKELTIPSDGAYIVMQIVHDGVVNPPSSFIVNGYDLSLNVKENVDLMITKFSGDIAQIRSDVQPAIDLSQMTTKVYDNILYGLNYRNAGGTGLVKSTDESGNIRLTLAQGAGADAGSWCWFGLNTKASNVFKHGHQYLVALDILVSSNSLTEGTTTAAGNNNFTMQPKSGNPPLGDYQSKQSAVTGTRGTMIALMRVTDSAEDGTFLFVQFGKYTSADYLDVTIYGACALDLESTGVTTWDIDGFNSALEKLSVYGFVDNVIAINNAVHCATSDRARIAESVESLNIGGDIDIWGDSLTAQGWGNDLAQITGRNVFSHGYGGRTSTYIRDQFLAGLNRDRTNIFWVGRNNVSRYDAVIDDIRTMVDALGTQKFIVMSVLNGAYAGEYKDQSAYAKFVKVAEKLKAIYPDNFVDIRTAIIQGWECGNVKLLSSFTQPAVGQNVQINVSDAAFLTTMNEYDVTYIGSDIMNKIVIGINDQYDTYSIVSYDDPTHMTIKLESVGRIATGQSVGNAIDPNNNPSVGTSTAIEYLRVMQNGDFVCINQYDTTPSTSRADRIHQSPAGRNFTARVIARALETKKL